MQERLLDLLDLKAKIEHQIKVASGSSARCFNEDGRAISLATLKKRLASVEAEEQAVQNIPAGGAET